MLVVTLLLAIEEKERIRGGTIAVKEDREAESGEMQ